MPSNEEKAEFAARLKEALRRSPDPIPGATELALRFNLRYEGKSVSPQTAHNWLAGRTIPQGPKLAVLAEWLKVSEHWLHYGSPPKRLPKIPRNSNQLVDKKNANATHLAERIQDLPSSWRYLIEEMVERLHKDLG